ncbi:MAG: hypothetical protein HY057_05375 [Rhodospirillales bacterium]|nr:hypothetical protein [Rhodospirillales bacterium]
MLISLIWRSPLCRAVALAVFISIVIIETIILVPSYVGYRQARIEEIGRVARAAVDAALIDFNSSASAEATLLPPFTTALTAAPITALMVRRADGQIVAQLGQWEDRATDAQLTWIRADASGEMLQIAAQVNTAEIGGQLTKFVFRVVGMVLLVSGFVTAATMVVLVRLVLAPLLMLHRSLMATARNPSNAEKCMLPVPSGNELGDVCRTFNQVLESVAANQEQLERQVVARTAQLRVVNEELMGREQEAREAQRRAETANHAKSRFLANMSHELRTPLNAILGFSEVIKDQMFGPSATAQYTDYAHEIHRSGRHLLDVLSDILDMSRIEEGRYELSDEAVDVAAIIAGCLPMISGRAQESRIELRNEIPTRLPLLSADQRAVKQVMLNLLSNAVKFTPKGGRVRIVAAIEATGDMAVSVIDNGVGITRAAQSAIFEPFQQGDPTVSRKYGGAGLGLSISKRFMQLHGGTLTLVSEVGVGTTVTARFPAARVATMEGILRAVAMTANK